jgi:GTPase SAR1 family protein
MSEKEYDHSIKLLLIGDDKVGKSSFIKRFMEDKFSNEPIDIKNLENKTKILEIEEKKIKIQIFNGVENQFKNRTNKNEFSLRIQGILVFFDLSNKTSFNNLDFYLEEIRSKCGSDMPLLIIGNKSDLEKAVNDEEIEKLCKDNDVESMSISVKNNINITESIEAIGKSIIFNSYFRGDTISIKNKNEFKKKKRGMC